MVAMGFHSRSAIPARYGEPHGRDAGLCSGGAGAGRQSRSGDAEPRRHRGGVRRAPRSRLHGGDHRRHDHGDGDRGERGGRPGAGAAGRGARRGRRGGGLFHLSRLAHRPGAALDRTNRYGSPTVVCRWCAVVADQSKGLRRHDGAVLGFCAGPRTTRIRCRGENACTRGGDRRGQYRMAPCGCGADPCVSRSPQQPHRQHHVCGAADRVRRRRVADVRRERVTPA